MKRYVAGFLFSPDRTEVLLIEKQSPAWQAGLVNGIGGKIEDGETPIAALVREFSEETGVQTTAEEWIAVVHYICPDSYEVFFYKAFSDKLYSAITQETEQVVRHNITALPSSCIFNLHWLVPLCLDTRLLVPPPIVVFEHKESEKSS